MHSSISFHSFLTASLRRKRSESDPDSGSSSNNARNGALIAGRRVSYTSLVGSSEYPYANQHYRRSATHNNIAASSTDSDRNDFTDGIKKLSLPTAGTPVSSSPCNTSQIRGQLRSSRSRTRASLSSSNSYGNPNGTNGTDISNGNMRNFPSSYSDYQLFTGRKPRPLSLPPSVSSILGSSSTTTSPAHHLLVNSSPIGNRTLSCSSKPENNINGSNGRKIPSGHITSSSKLPSSYTQKFPVSYFTPEPVIAERSSSASNDSGKGGGCSSALRRALSTGRGSAKSVTPFGSNSEQDLTTDGFVPFPSLYQSSKCFSYSFHGHPVPCSNDSSNSPSGGSRSTSDDTSPGSGSLRLQINKGFSNLKSNGNDKESCVPPEYSSRISDDESICHNSKSSGLDETNQFRANESSSKESISSSIKVVFNKSSFRGSAMSSSKSFTHASFFTEETCLSNTLPRMGKNKGIHRSSEQIALFLDILSSQEKFVKVFFFAFSFFHYENRSQE